MKVILVMVSTLNGKITKGNDPHISTWTSLEDKKHFSKLIEDAKLIIMGSKTYEAAKETMQHKEGRLRVVVTRHPERYMTEKKEGVIEFRSESPGELVQRFEGIGYQEALLLGGGELNAAFLKAGVVDEIHLTLEPFLFGKGKQLIAEEEFSSSLELISSKKLNEQGTLLLRYRFK
ncbi:MAG: dihydrofolate reductase [Candidatus Levybacteria bacterium]|nr:dihydrofolate reductase [Candidatus Levybacteria bacterium]